ncbi:hypothetical protein MHB71_04985 [Paenibacillus sp. FSL H7-0940]|uniref:hypothetical protein n=1 Tax=Paenibacillus sp. FSL H7-0940 TaxID=2921443 RepID=UPI0030EBCE0C
MTNINGRKAVITNRLQRWSSFEALANQLGCPDAAVPSEQDYRTRPQDGDVVTVLSSVGKRGETVTRDNQRVFIVEAANGERHIYGEKGLRILDEKVTGVTVLKDESLGGVEREYREVKRKACVGERIKVTGSLRGFYEDGDIGVVTEFDGDDDAWADFENGERACIGKPDAVNGYLALYPTDIVRINGTRFRMVDRKAAAGERVIVVSDHMCHAIPPGVVGQIGRSDTFDYDSATYFVGNDQVSDIERDYRVLEPLTSAKFAGPVPLLSAKPAPDQAAEIIAKLTTRVASLERRVTMLEVASAKPIPRRVAQERPSVTVAEASAALAQRAKEARQRKRDDIVKRAKEDVADLRKFAGTQVPNDSVKFWPRANKPTLYTAMHTVEYVVNRDKRTVVAIIRCTIDGKITRGIAKCTPGDVFNVWIGKAIALRRALGLEIPEEYVSAPQPTEVRVGDIVKATGSSAFARGSSGPVVSFAEDGVLYCSDESWRADGCVWAFEHDLSVTDDSREAESDSAEPRKEVA